MRWKYHICFGMKQGQHILEVNVHPLLLLTFPERITMLVYFVCSYRYCKNKPYPKSRFCRGVPGMCVFSFRTSNLVSVSHNVPKDLIPLQTFLKASILIRTIREFLCPWGGIKAEKVLKVLFTRNVLIRFRYSFHCHQNNGQVCRPFFSLFTL